MDLDLWDCFGRKKLCLIIEEIRYIYGGNNSIIFIFYLYSQCALKVKKITTETNIFMVWLTMGTSDFTCFTGTTLGVSVDDLFTPLELTTVMDWPSI